MNSDFKKSILPNGVRIVTEQHPYSRSVSLGVWISTGTRDEASSEVGLSHFLEHLVFKGTKKRNAYQIAKSLESLGGDLNAFTTREYTHYHCLVLKEDWKLGLDVLADLSCNMQITKKNFELEKKVILQEIVMSDDTPEDIIYDYFFEGVYKGHPLSRQILGKSQTIEKMTLKKVIDFYSKYYQGKNLIISAAGPVEHDAVVIECQKLFKNKKDFRLSDKRKKPKWTVTRKIIEKELEQAHILVGFPTTSFFSRYRFEAFILNSVLGGGMTSRLYQAIREKQGLAYTVYSSLNTNIDSASICVYAGTDMTNIQKVIRIIAKELFKIKKNGFKKHDLELFKKQVRGQLLMGSDDIENRMASLGLNEMIFNEYKSVEAVIKEIESVSLDSMHRFLNESFDLNKVSVVVMGHEIKKHQEWLNSFDFSKENPLKKIN